MKVITINTDAGYSRYHKKGTYAFWIVCNDDRYKTSGVLRGDCVDPTEAEYKCIVNAIKKLSTIASINLANYDKIIVNTDNKDCIAYITGTREITRNLKNPKKVLDKVLDDFSIRYRLELRYVKAHNGTPDSRSWVNDWCDSQCKKQLQDWIRINDPEFYPKKKWKDKRNWRKGWKQNK